MEERLTVQERIAARQQAQNPQEPLSPQSWWTKRRQITVGSVLAVTAALGVAGMTQETNTSRALATQPSVVSDYSPPTTNRRPAVYVNREREQEQQRKDRAVCTLDICRAPA